MRADSLTDEEKRRLFWRGAMRLGFGVAQTTGATVALYLLISIGPEKPTLVVTAITFAFTIASRIIFRRDTVPTIKPSER